MNDTKSMTICILEQQTKPGPLKASQLAYLIEGYIKVHPEITSGCKTDKEETT